MVETKAVRFVDSKKRVDEIDILKALGIICMVAGHSSAPFTHFIYLFHMAIFFISSGFCFKVGSSNSIKDIWKYILRKIKSLWIPFFVWNAIYVLLHNFFISINVYTDNHSILEYVFGTYIGTTAPYTVIEMIKHIVKGALFSCGEQMFGACWFLKILFMVSVCYVIGDFLAKKVFKKYALVVQFIASAILLAFGYWCFLKGHNFHGIASTASFYCLYFIGHILSLYKDKYVSWNWKQFLFLLALSYATLIIFNLLGSINLSQNSYENPAFLLATSFVGWVFLYSISYFIKQVPYLKRMMIGIGKRTLTVVILHFLSLKLVATIVVTAYGMPYFCVAAFPNLYGGKGLWWLAYTIVGVSVPVVLNIVYHLSLSRLSRPAKMRIGCPVEDSLSRKRERQTIADLP